MRWRYPVVWLLFLSITANVVLLAKLPRQTDTFDRMSESIYGLLLHKVGHFEESILSNNSQRAVEQLEDLENIANVLARYRPQKEQPFWNDLSLMFQRTRGRIGLLKPGDSEGLAKELFIVDLLGEKGTSIITDDPARQALWGEVLKHWN